MSDDPRAAALAALDESAAELAAVRARHKKELAPVMDRVRANILAADAVSAATREAIVERSGVSRRTAYKIFPVERTTP